MIVLHLMILLTYIIYIPPLIFRLIFTYLRFIRNVDSSIINDYNEIDDQIKSFDVISHHFIQIDDIDNGFRSNGEGSILNRIYAITS